MRISKQIVLYAFALLTAVFAVQDAHATDPRMADRVMGDAKARVMIVEYASLTCTHCAEFMDETFPELKKRYIDTGKVKYVLRDFPLDGIALRAAALARCLPSEQYYPFTHVLFQNQKQWAFGQNDPIKNLMQYAGLAGLSSTAADACLKDTKLMDALMSARTEASEQHKIQATPTFIFNDGETELKGGLPIDDFAKVIDRLLAAKK